MASRLWRGEERRGARVSGGILRFDRTSYIKEWWLLSVREGISPQIGEGRRKGREGVALAEIKINVLCGSKSKSGGRTLNEPRDIEKARSKRERVGGWNGRWRRQTIAADIRHQSGPCCYESRL